MRLMRDIFRSHAVLDDNGRHVNGTDKESNHSYGDAYEQLFYGSKLVDVKITDTRTEPMHERTTTRGDVKLMMEVGVADGSSLCAWREIFPNALCVGMDIHPSYRAHGDRIEFNLGDQRVQRDCERAAAGRMFDLIVDDATHQLEDTLRTLLFLWQFVAPGGLYVVEEFPNIGELWPNVLLLYPHASVVDTRGPFGGVEPLVVLRKPL